MTGVINTDANGVVQTDANGVVQTDTGGVSITVSQQKSQTEALVRREYDSKGVNTLSATVNSSNIQEVQLEVSRNGGAYERAQKFDESSLENVDFSNPDGTVNSNIPGGIREGFAVFWDDPQQDRLLLIYGNTSTPKEMKWAESPTGDPTTFQNYQTVFTNPDGGNMESPTVFWDGTTLHGYYESDRSNFLVDHMTADTRTGDTNWTVQSTLPSAFASPEAWRYEGEAYVSGEYWEQNTDENNLVVWNGHKHGQLDEEKIVAFSNNFSFQRHLAIKSIFHDAQGNMYAFANARWSDGEFDNLTFYSKDRDADGYPINWQAGSRKTVGGNSLHGLVELFNRKVLYGFPPDNSALYYWEMPSTTRSRSISTAGETVSFDYYETALSPGDSLSWRVVGIKDDGTEVVSDAQTFDVVSEPDYQVAIESTTSAAPGGTLEVTCRLTNTGLASGSQTVTLEIDNSVGQVDSTSVSLNAGADSTTQTLSWAVPSGQAKQDYQATVSSADDSASQTVTVSSGPPASLVSHWTFDTADTNSGTAVDTVGSNDGTISGATTGVSGANQTYTTNEAYSFDGSDDFVEVADDASLSITGDISISAWLKLDGANANNFFQGISSKAGGASVGYSFMLTSSGLDYAVRIDGSRHTINTGPPQGTWVHTTAVLSGSTVTFYEDGSAVSSTSANTLGSTSSGAFYIGRNSWNADDGFNGDIDDVRVYDKALTSTEVSNLYNNGRI